MTPKCLNSLLVAVFALFFAVFSVAAQDTHPGTEVTAAGGHAEKPFNAGDEIIHHVKDAYDFHFFSVGNFDATLPLPVLVYSPSKGFSAFSSSKFEHGHAEYNGYKLEDGHLVSTDGSKFFDFSLTKNVVQMLLATIVLILLMLGIAKKYNRGTGVKTAPTGFQNAVEPVITFVRDEVAKPNLGKKWKKYLPYLLTVFFFILINNLFGLIPGAANVTGNINFTLVLALISLLVILLSTNGHFWGHIFWPPGVPLGVKLILIPIEFVSIFIKPAALMIRLFANMIAGHIIILSFIALIFIFGGMNKVAGWGFSPLSMIFTIFIYCIELLVAFIQAFIFTNLTAVFIGQAFEGGHDDVDGHADPVIV